MQFIDDASSDRTADDTKPYVAGADYDQIRASIFIHSKANDSGLSQTKLRAIWDIIVPDNELSIHLRDES